jgi:tetratricopeptide (TPR) repeat protein
MAQGEAIQQRWPDTIDDLTRALEQVPNDDIAGRVELLTERGEYYLRNRNFQAAVDDWQSALDLSHSEATAAMRLGTTAATAESLTDYQAEELERLQKEMELLMETNTKLSPK